MDRDTILDEIIKYSSPDGLRSDEFTVYDYMERRRERGDVPVARITASCYLNKLVAQGKLTMRQVLVGSRWCNAYSKRKEVRQGGYSV